MSAKDAEFHALEEVDIVRVESRRGQINAPKRVSDIRDGSIFAPFHYGYWDEGGTTKDRYRATNELTITEWDPVSKQPVLKNAAVKVTKVATGTGSSPAPTTTAPRPATGKLSQGRRNKTNREQHLNETSPEQRRARGKRTILPTVGGPAAQATETITPVDPPVMATKEEHS